MRFQPKKSYVKLYRCAVKKEDEDKNAWCLYAHNILIGVGITKDSLKTKTLWYSLLCLNNICFKKKIYSTVFML